MHSMGKTIDELHAMLKTHEETLPKKVDIPVLHVIRTGRVQKHNPSKAAKRNQRKGKGKVGKSTPSYTPKPKITPPPKKDNPAKDASCHQCGKVGHWRRNGPVYLTELLKKRKLSQGASTLGIFTIELYFFLVHLGFMTLAVVFTFVILLRV